MQNHQNPTRNIKCDHLWMPWFRVRQSQTHIVNVLLKGINPLVETMLELSLKWANLKTFYFGIISITIIRLYYKCISVSFRDGLSVVSWEFVWTMNNPYLCNKHIQMSLASALAKNKEDQGEYIGPVAKITAPSLQLQHSSTTNHWTDICIASVD